METKNSIRSLLIKRRLELSEFEVRKRSTEITLKLEKELKVFLKDSDCDMILAYMPIKNEVDIRGLLDRILYGNFCDRKLRLALPKVIGNEMNFFEVDSLKNLKKSKFGILEPHIGKKIMPRNTFVVVPGVGFFDNRRLGFGAGYYDRYFNLNKNNFLCGVAYKFQLEQKFLYEEHDIIMDKIIVDD